MAATSGIDAQSSRSMDTGPAHGADASARPGSGAVLSTVADAPVNILIVDDEPKNLLVLETLLDAPGYRIVRAESADQALLALVAEEFALLILDVRMPGMTGFELAQTIKGRKKTERVPIIFLTAYYNEDQHVLEGYGSGAVDYLHKPVNAAVLRSKVAIFVELHRKSREIAISNRALLAEVGERRRAEEQLRELNDNLDRVVVERTQALMASEARYRTLFHSIDEGFCIVAVETDETGRAADLRFVEVNAAFEKHSGLSDVVGKRVRELVPDFERDWLDTFAGVWRSGIAVRQAGEVASLGRFVEIFAFRLGAGDAARVAILLRDVTEPRRAQEALRERERFLRTVTGAAQIGLAVVEPGAVYRYANDAYLQMLELPASMVAGSSVHELVAGAWSPAGPQLDRALAGERVSFEFDLAATARVPRPRHFGAFYEPHVDDKGRPTVVVVVLEITHLKQLESQLREADRRKDEFIATLAHELRNPLAPVRNAVEILRRKSAASPELTAGMQIIERQIRVMVRLIDDLMDVSRINQGRIELRRESIPLAQVLEAAIEASRPQIAESGHELVLDLPAEPIVIDADATRLAQVFTNLLGNAAKYTDRGGRIRLSVRREDSGVSVAVADNGIGIPPEKLASVFLMFSQVEDALSRSRGGLGIGLSLARRLVELHGGRVEARSDGLGHGSTFVVVLRLPGQAVAEDVRPAIAEAHAPGAAANALKVLVVDDNRDGADTLSELLSLLGHDVRTVYDGEAAVLGAGEFRPDVMLLDIGLPYVNGYEACRRVREQEWGKGITVIAMTGWGDAESKRRGLSAGFDHHLVKPVDEEVLIAMLADLRASSPAAAAERGPAG